MRRTAPIIATAALAALVLTGCSGGEDEPSPQDAWKDSPLNQYMSAAWGGDLSPEEQQRRFLDQQKEAEELAAQCMAEQGFEYQPVDRSSGVSFGSSDAEAWNPDSREWVSQWGYGAVNWPGQEEMESPEPGEEFVDPNQDYVMSLSETEQAAYYEALYGPQPTEEELGEDGSYEYNWETAGCQGKAQHEIGGAQSLYESEEFADLFAAMEKLYQDVQNDPRMADLDAEWASCMTDAGHSGFSKQFDAQQSIYDEMNTYWESAPQPDPSMSEEEITAFYEEQEAQRKKEMEPIAEKEIDLALADLDCREKTDYRTSMMDIQFEIEQEFVDAHKTELEAFKAAAEQQG